MHAQGPFDVQLAPTSSDHASSAAIGRMMIDKRYHGDLEATGHGQMLAHRTATPGLAGYVAMEIVAGTLGGRSGSFVLQHSGSMAQGSASLVVEVVPDSGTGALVGIAGRMAIVIEGGKHSYAFDYTLPGNDG